MHTHHDVLDTSLDSLRRLNRLLVRHFAWASLDQAEFMLNPFQGIIDLQDVSGVGREK